MESKNVVWFWVLSLSSTLLLLLPIVCVGARTITSSSSSSSSHPSPFAVFKDLEGSRKGNKVEGIHKVKSYLQRFGYMSSTSRHLDAGDDYFDDALESAIKSFQTFYHLTPTGVLDGPTAELMSKPRCGVPDINNAGTNSSSISPKFAFFPGSPSWPAGQRDLLYTLSTGSFPEAAEAVANAFDAWAGVSSFTFERTSSSGSADLSVSFQEGEHGDGAPFDGPGGVLAHAFAPVDGRFHFDEEETWVVGEVPGGMDLETVATHEIGHLLGLGHSSDRSAVMFASISAGTTKGLGQDDIDGIQALYSEDFEV